MSFRMDIQSAPERRGETGAVDLTGGAGPTWTGATPTFSGTYLGDRNRTLTFTGVTAGTIATTAVITVTWTDGTESGRLDLGTDHDYVAGQARPVIAGVSVAFGAGAVTATQTFTVTVTAANRLPRGFLSLLSQVGDKKLDVEIVSMDREDVDLRERTWDGREILVPVALLRPSLISIDSLTSVTRQSLLAMESRRSKVTIGEDYDVDSVFLWRGQRGTSLLPFIGPAGTFGRSSLGSYIDPVTGLIRTALSGVSRYPAGQVGSAMSLDGGTTNLFVRSSSKSGTLYFTAVGAPTSIAFDPNVRPPTDPTDATSATAFAAFLAGTLRVAFGSGTVTTDLAHSDDVTTVGSTQYTLSVSIYGRGNITIQARSGAATPAVNVASNVQALQSWVRHQITFTTGVGHVVTDFAIVSRGTQAVCWAANWQLEAKPSATDLVQTDGASGSRSAETVNFPIAVPPQGMLAFWLRWGGDDSASAYALASGSGVTGAQRFALWYNAAASVLQFYTNTTGGSALDASLNMAADTWYHLGLTWGFGSSNNVARAIYVNGALAANDLSANHEPSFGTGLDLAPSLAGVTHVASRYQEIRMGATSTSTATMLDVYERMALEEWLVNIQAAWGRKMRLYDVTEVWRGKFAPQSILMTARASECDREDDSVLVTAR